MTEHYPPPKDGSGVIGGRKGEAWGEGIFDSLTLNGITYAFPAADGNAGETLVTDGAGTFSFAATGSATAWDDIGDPDADATVAFAGYKQIISSTLNSAGAVLTMTNTTADLTADVAFMDFKYTDDGDANGFFLRGYDNAGNDLKWSIGADGAFTTVGLITGSLGATITGGVVSINASSNFATNIGTGTTNAAVTIGGGSNTVAVNSSAWAISTTGVATGLASVGYTNGSATYVSTVTITAAEVKALRATPKTLIAAAGAGTIIEFKSAVFVLDYGSEVFTETADNLVIEFEDGRDITAAIETTGFLDQNADQVAMIVAASIPTMTAATAVNKAVRLTNTGDGEIGGNASDDSILYVKVTYAVHTITLA